MRFIKQKKAESPDIKGDGLFCFEIPLIKEIKAKANNFLRGKPRGIYPRRLKGQNKSVNFGQRPPGRHSMNVTENQGSNAGLHEAMIGAGLFIGPAFGAATLYLVPTAIGIGAWSVGGLLCAGFFGLLFMRHYRIKS